MSKPPSRKPLKWVGSAKRDLDAMPDDVKDVFGYAIDLAEAGGKHMDAKPLSGFGSAGVLEVVEDFQGDTYRAVYTVRFGRLGVRSALLPEEVEERDQDATAGIDLIKMRLKAAETDFEASKKTSQGAKR